MSEIPSVLSKEQLDSFESMDEVGKHLVRGFVNDLMRLRSQHKKTCSDLDRRTSEVLGLTRKTAMLGLDVENLKTIHSQEKKLVASLQSEVIVLKRENKKLKTEPRRMKRQAKAVAAKTTEKHVKHIVQRAEIVLL